VRFPNGGLSLLLPGFSVAAVLLALFVAATPRTVTAVRILGGPTEGSSVLSWRIELVEVGGVERVAAERHFSLRWALANGERGTIRRALEDDGAANVSISPGTGPVAGPVHVKVYASGASGPVVDAPLWLTNAAWLRGAHGPNGGPAGTSTFRVHVDNRPMLWERLWWHERPSGCYPCRFVIEASPARKRAYTAFVSHQGPLSRATVELTSGRGEMWLPPFPGDDPVWALVSSSPAFDAPDRVSWPVRRGSDPGPATTFDVPDAVLFDNVSETAALARSGAQRLLLLSSLLPVITAALVLIAVSRRARSAQRRFHEALVLLSDQENSLG
jgi:hypothetical protein